MNCDQVFDVLTRGPFPAGSADDASVERHLLACHECRRLAEALSPAVDLFHEALSDESAELPGYRGALHADRLGARIATAIEAAPAPLRAEKVAPRRSGGREVFLSALAVAAMCLIWVAGGVEANPPQDSDPAARLVSMELDSAQLAQIDRLTSANCTPARRRVAANERYCCTSCHAAVDSMAGRQRALKSLVASCQVCHQQSKPEKVSLRATYFSRVPALLFAASSVDLARMLAAHAEQALLAVVERRVATFARIG